MPTGSTQIISPYTPSPDRVKEQQGPLTAHELSRRTMDSSRVADHRAWKEACRGRVSATWWNSKMRPPTADRSVTPISMSNEHEAATAIATEEGLHHRDSWKFDIRKFTEDGGISNQNIETTLSLNPPTPDPPPPALAVSFLQAWLHSHR